VRSFWWPRFRAVARWFVIQESQRRAQGIETLAVESKGEMVIAAGGRDHVITARADRIDGRPDGYAIVIDYKTGTPPKKAQMEAGYRPQLPLEGAMIAKGGFKDVAARPIGAIEVWQLKGGQPAGQITAFGDSDAARLVDQAIDGVARLLARYADPRQPYLATPNPKQAAYGDYDHLARVGEWGQGDSE